MNGFDRFMMAVDDSKRMWSHIYSFEEACMAMAFSIKNGLPWHPGQWVPENEKEFRDVQEDIGLDRESGPIANDIVKINKSGMLTTFSQPAIQSRSVEQIEAIHGVVVERVSGSLARRARIESVAVDIMGSRRRHEVTWQNGKPFTFNSAMPMDRLLSSLSGATKELLEDIERRCVTVALTNKSGRVSIFERIPAWLSKRY